MLLAELPGEVFERFKETVLKTVDGKLSVGSNPTLSAKMSKEAMSEVLGIDLGGTAIKAGRFSVSPNQAQATPQEYVTVPTPSPATPEAVLEALIITAEKLDPGGNLPVGIGVPGVVDPTARIARTAINLSNWHEVPLAESMEKRTERTVVLGNDANCAGLGEAWLGAGRGFQDLLVLTLGTGVGGTIILNGRLFVGHRGAGAELGHICINEDGPPCNCGSRGCLEQYISATAIHRRTGVDPKVLGEKADGGDPEALAWWERIGSDLGVGLTSLLYTLTPEAVVVGGGVAASSAHFFPKALEEVEKRVLFPCREGFQLLPAQLGNEAGTVGAARLVLDLT